MIPATKMASSGSNKGLHFVFCTTVIPHQTPPTPLHTHTFQWGRTMQRFPFLFWKKMFSFVLYDVPKWKCVNTNYVLKSLLRDWFDNVNPFMLANCLNLTPMEIKPRPSTSKLKRRARYVCPGATRNKTPPSSQNDVAIWTVLLTKTAVPIPTHRVARCRWRQKSLLK